ncbi:MAG: lysylphosphatidylglycerol synthase transmembrane domain-containing protein [Sandaracinaceae bacterium]
MSDDVPDSDPPPEQQGRTKKRLLLALRVAGTLIAFGYIASIVEFDALTAAVGRVSVGAFLAACALTFGNLVVGAVRWRVLLAAYGAPHRPSVAKLAQVYWIGFFYNSFLPGGVGGDVVRGIVTRQSFGERGATASMTVVLVERVLGLSGLLLIVGASAVLRPVEGTEAVFPYSLVGLFIAACAVTAVAIGRRLSPHLPGRLSTLAASLPVIERWPPFFGALGISLITQTLVALTGYCLLHAIDPAVGITDALLVVPLAMAAAFFPLSVGGAGAREAAFVGLCGVAFGMPESDALAASLLLWATQLAVAALGGLSQLVVPLKVADEPSAEET